MSPLQLMSTDLASPQPTIDTADSDVTVLAQSLHDCFALIQDHRSTRTLLHQLSDILTIAVLAVIAGGNGWEDMSLYGLSKYDWLSTFLALPRACLNILYSPYFQTSSKAQQKQRSRYLDD